MSNRLALLEYVQAISSGGTATATIGPKKYGDTWVVNMLAASTNSTTESTLRVYRGAPVPSAQVASTYSANNDNASGSPIQLTASDKLVFVWSGASDGAICTCRIEGDLMSERY